MTTSISNIIKGIIISFITTIIFLLIFSIILTYTNISENFIESETNPSFRKNQKINWIQ